MTFDFDTPVERAGTDSQKWQKYAGRDVLPLWVADMDFKSPPAIVDALHRRVDHGIFGYARPVKATVDAAARTAFNGGQAVAVLLRQTLIGIKDFGKKKASS